jgi:DNA-binding PadR family transcriptional regulator
MGQRGWGGPGPWGGAWGSWGGPWGGRPGGQGPGGHGQGGHGGPPPWLAGIFGLTQPEQQRGPRVRRGDVRAAILDVVRAASESGEPINGYQVIQQIAERSGGAWRPSPGSVYPTIQQLQDEGLLEVDDERGRRALRLTAEGEAYVADNAEELASVWTPFESRDRQRSSDFSGLKPEIGQVMGAVWQIVTTGTDRQRREAVEILVETRRKLYGVLAEGETGHTGDDDVDDLGDEGGGPR